MSPKEGRICVENASNYVDLTPSSLSFSGNNALEYGSQDITKGDYNYNFPNKTGTLALISDIPTGAAANKGVDTSISAASNSTNLPTSKAVATFVEGKGYKTTDYNQTIKSGTTTFGANDAVEIVAGTNVTVTPDATNKKITISSTDTTYNNATTSAAGLMSKDDKTKLNGITSGATKVEASTTNGKIKINGTETTVYTHPGSGTNPHGTTKTDVGLGNVGNFKAVSTVASQGLTSTEKSNARANIGAGTSSLTLGTTATTAAKGDHTHTTSIAVSSGTNQLTLEHGKKYALNAGGTSYIFTMPSDNNTTYTIATGDSNGQIKVTPSSGSAYSVSVKGLGSSAYTTTYKAAECTSFTSDSGNCTPAAVQKAAKQFAYAGPLTGYTKATTTAAVAATDTIVSAIGKLEKALDGKGTSNLTLGTTATTAAKGNHTHSAATTSAAGLMSAADKTKLDTISNNYVKEYNTGKNSMPSTIMNNGSSIDIRSGNDSINVIGEGDEHGVGISVGDNNFVNFYQDRTEMVDAPVKIKQIQAPTASNGTTYGLGTSGQVLKSNGTSVYWANDNTTSGSEATYYMHRIALYSTSSPTYRLYITLYNKSNTKLTYSTLVTWLTSKGCTSQDKMYSCTGMAGAGGNFVIGVHVSNTNIILNYNGSSGLSKYTMSQPYSFTDNVYAVS